MPSGTRQATVTHDDRDLIQGFGQLRPEIPLVFGAAHTGAWVTFDRMVKVGEFERVTDRPATGARGTRHGSGSTGAPADRITQAYFRWGIRVSSIE